MNAQVKDRRHWTDGLRRFSPDVQGEVGVASFGKRPLGLTLNPGHPLQCPGRVLHVAGDWGSLVFLFDAGGLLWPLLRALHSRGVSPVCRSLEQ